MRKIYSTLCTVILVCTVLDINAQTNKPAPKKKFIFSAQGGWGQRISQTEDGLAPGLEKHVNALKGGLALDLEAGVLINPSNAITLTWGMFRASNNSDVFQTSLETGQSVSTRVNTRDNINLLMVNWLSYFNLGEQSRVRAFGQIGAGLAMYRSENEFIFGTEMLPATITGTGLATNLGAGIDYRISNSVSLVLQANYVMANPKIKVEEGIPLEGSAEKERLNQIRVLTGLRFRL